VLSEQSSGESEVKVNVIAEARAIAKFVRMSPRKVRFVLAAIKGKRVSEALDVLSYIPNHAAAPLAKVIRSAAANAQESWGAGPDELKVANIIADGGPILKRIRARAQGRAYRILKRTSHITAVLWDTPPPKPKRRKPAKKKSTQTPQAQQRPPKTGAPAAAPFTEEPTVAASVVEAASSSAPETVVTPEMTAAQPVLEVAAEEEAGAEAPQDSAAETPPATPEGESDAQSGDAEGEKA
jgi:large subunit ribosomal protein L22